MKIKIYATSDVHGTLTPYRYSDHKEMNMGMMKLSPFMKKDEHKNIKRHIDWNRGEPYTFKNEDYNELKNSECFFARKFSSKIDKKIIDNLTK